MQTLRLVNTQSERHDSKRQCEIQCHLFEIYSQDHKHDGQFDFSSADEVDRPENQPVHDLVRLEMAVVYVY